MHIVGMNLMIIKAMVERILHQIRRDKRTLGLIIFAPIILLSVLYFLLETPTQTLVVGVVNGSLAYEEALIENNLITQRMVEAGAIKALEEGKIIAWVKMDSNKPIIFIDGSNAAKSNQALGAFCEAYQQYTMKATINRPDLRPDVRYVYGSQDLSTFDNLGAPLIGVIVFFLVFLVAGINFLKERTSGTLEKLLSTPIKCWEIVVGYSVGFGVITSIQSVIITIFVVYVLNIILVGSFWMVLLVNLLTAMAALTLGLLLSTTASSEFQFVQFIPMVITPQIFFCGIFELSPFWDLLARTMPLYYTADALSEVMLKGAGVKDIAFDLIVLASFGAVFMILNSRVLLKHRGI